MPPGQDTHGRLLSPLDRGVFGSVGEQQQELLANLSQEVSQVRRLAMQQAKQAEAERKAEAVAVKSFLATSQRREVDHLEALFPQLRSQRVSLGLEPTISNRSFMVLFHADLKDVLSVSSWVHQQARHHNLQTALASHWATSHQLIAHKQQPVLQELDSLPAPCLQRGFCTCTRHGQAVSKMKNRFKAVLGAQLPQELDTKRWLPDGFLVVKVTEVVPPAESQEEAGASGTLPPASTVSGLRSAGQSKWMHLALQYYRPWRPTFQHLQERPSFREDWICLQQTGEFLSEWEVWQTLDQQSRWTLAFHTIISTEAPIGELQPSLCYVSKTPLQEPATLWPLQTKGRKPRSHPPAKRQRTQKLATSTVQDEVLLAFAPGLAAEDEAIATAAPLCDESGSEEADEPAEGGSLDPEGEEEGGSLEELLEALLDSVGTQEEEARAIAPVDDLGAELFGEGHIAEGALGAGEEAANREEVAEPPMPQLGPEQPGVPQVGEPAPADLEGLPRPKPKPQPAAAQRGKADLRCAVPGGTISYYANKHIFQATCSNAGHHRCVMTRAAAGGTKASQGRPLGFLCAWLHQGQALASKEEHWNRGQWPDRAARTHHRSLLKDKATGPMMLSLERPKGTGELSEPEDLP